MTYEVRELYVKPAAGEVMRRVREVVGVAGRGLIGDAHADPCSPRHVLIVAAPHLRALGVSGAELRANVVVDGEIGGLASGEVVAFGDLRLRITIPCEACARLNAVRAGLAREVGEMRGVLARVVASGAVTVGARGRVAGRLPALDADWTARVEAIVRAIPEDRIVSYAALAAAAGVQAVYCRALPAVLRKLAARGAPTGRVIPASRAAQDGRRRWDASLHYSVEEADP